MKKIIVSLLLLVTFCFPVFSQKTAIPLRTFVSNNGIELLKKEFSSNASQMYEELLTDYIGNVDEYEIIKVESFIDFLDWVESENYISVVKTRYTQPVSEDKVGMNNPNPHKGNKKIAIIYLKNQSESFDKLICYLINY
jgi:hypothetical protein